MFHKCRKICNHFLSFSFLSSLCFKPLNFNFSWTTWYLLNREKCFLGHKFSKYALRNFVYVYLKFYVKKKNGWEIFNLIIFRSKTWGMAVNLLKTERFQSKVRISSIEYWLNMSDDFLNWHSKSSKIMMLAADHSPASACLIEEIINITQKIWFQEMS